MGVLHTLVGRWVAGQTADDALDAVRVVNRKGMRGLVNVMVEHSSTKAEAERVTGQYLGLLESFHTQKLRADISVKLSSLGLGLGKGYCLRQLLTVVHRAKELNCTVWLDMEQSIDDTLELYRQVFPHYHNTAVALQANRSRSPADLKSILKMNGRVRLVKGAYRGDIRHWEEVELAYSRLMRTLFSQGTKFAIATHDSVLLEEAFILAERYHAPWEIQVLRGVRPDLARSLSTRYPVSVYIPFGSDIAPYLLRRIKEHPSLLLEVFQ